MLLIDLSTLNYTQLYALGTRLGIKPRFVRRCGAILVREAWLLSTFPETCHSEEQSDEESLKPSPAPKFTGHNLRHLNPLNLFQQVSRISLAEPQNLPPFSPHSQLIRSSYQPTPNIRP